MENMMLTVYLDLFYEAWKKGYKLGWIYHEMVRLHSEVVVDDFFRTEGQPLVPSIPRPEAGTRYYLTVVNKHFSDWVFSKIPPSEKFRTAILKTPEKFLDTPQKWALASALSNRHRSTLRKEALDALGGDVEDLKPGALVYAARGRKTGKGMSEKTWAK